MNKLIQTIALTLVVFSPVSLITLITSAAAHHTPSHVSNLAIQTNVARKKKKVRTPRVTGKKISPTGAMKKKPAATGATAPQPETGIPANGSTSPVKLPTKPINSLPTSKVKPIDPTMGNPTAKPGSTTKLPDASPTTPSIPLATPGSVPNPAGINPSLPRPNLPNLPTGTTK
jgi:hypothetical protein